MVDEAASEPDALHRRIHALSPERRLLLGRRLAELQKADRQPLPRLRREAGINRLPATPGQERLFFHQQLRPESPAYVLPVALRLTGALREDVLRDALASLVRRHEPLRTGFEVAATDGLVQVVRDADEMSVPLAVESVTAGEVPTRLAELAGQPFDLSSPPLIRIALWEVPDDGQGDEGEDPAGVWILALTAHHAVLDGWSLGILIEDLVALYGAAAEGRAPELAPLGVQFADFAAWERQQAEDPETERHVAYWRESLADARAPALPVGGHRRPDRGAGGCHAVPVAVSPALTAVLTRLGQSAEATPFMVLLSAFALVLERWSGQSDLLVCTATAGRSRPELERLVGFFARTVPLRLTVDPTGTFDELLARTRSRCLDAYAHESLPLHRILTAADAEQTGGRLMRLTVMISMRDVPMGRTRLPGVSANVLELPSGGTDFDLSLDLHPNPEGGVSGWLHYSGELFARETVERVAAAFLDVLEAVGSLAGNGSAPLSELPGPREPISRYAPAPGDPAERQRLVVHGALVDVDEVTAALRKQPGVGDAVVLARSHEDGGHRLLAYVTGSRPGTVPAGDSLRRRLAECLPPPMVPDHVTALDSFPLTAGGRLDRGALPVPDQARTRHAGAYAPPSGELEQVLADVWGRTLDVEDPGRDDDFFRLGGHSLLATLMVSRVRELFRVELPLHFFVEAPTIASLAALVREQARLDGADADRIAGLVRRVQQMSADAVEAELRK
ncbi:condensation domain-containing protein [Streptomyces albicerus]|uniref:condensation domain-containing protein n=1 Tax=Streptomyces albicerus TaxID=2569859 RepID=UPI00124AEBC5|nr:condensation domain-containing protein [Streptomyces albicerus]